MLKYLAITSLDMLKNLISDHKMRFYFWKLFNLDPTFRPRSMNRPLHQTYDHQSIKNKRIPLCRPRVEIHEAVRCFCRTVRHVVKVLVAFKENQFNRSLHKNMIIDQYKKRMIPQPSPQKKKKKKKKNSLPCCLITIIILSISLF